jgi:polar amino acid transport system ATP-binding protein
LRQRVNVGYVFQNFNLFPHLTVLENLIEAPIAHGLASRKAATERALTLLDAVGLRNKADAWSSLLWRSAAAYRYCPCAGAKSARHAV